MTPGRRDRRLVAGTWTIDPSHSEVGFSVRHLMSKVRGRFADFSGTITTAENILDSTRQGHHQELLDHHQQRAARRLTSARPTSSTRPRAASCASSAPRSPRAGDGYVITGDLTINGITKSVDLAAEFLGVESDPYGQTKLGAEATTSINRKDFNVNWNQALEGGKLLVGDKVEITLAVQATKA